MDTLRQRLIQNPRLRAFIQWTALFVGLVVAIYAATQNRDAPIITLFVFLYVITVNFSIPVPNGRVGLVPMLAVSSLLVVGFQAAVLAMILGLVLAELARPIWHSIWPVGLGQRLTLGQRLGLDAAALVALLVAHQIYIVMDGILPLDAEDVSLLNTAGTLNENLLQLVWLAIAYFLTDLLLQWLLTLLYKQSLSSFLQRNLPGLLGFGVLSQPFALFGALTYVSVGLPAFVIFGIGMAGFMIVAWISWQNRTMMSQQLEQFSTLNLVSQSLRETLDLPAVLEQTYTQIHRLVVADRFTIALLNPDGRWQEAFQAQHKQSAQLLTDYQPDDFTRWVATHKQILDLDNDNMHYAAEHQLRPPSPAPAVWLGIPLINDQQLIGVLSLERFAPAQPFTRWNRELLVAIAQQASRAIPNAQLHGETVRLYALTDEALARRVEQLQALLNSTHDGVLMLDVNGRIVLLNPLAARLLQQAQGEPLSPTAAVQRLGYQTAAIETLLQQLAAGETPPVGRTVIQLPAHSDRNGTTPRYIERAEAPVLTEDGRTMGWLIVLRDVTEEQERAQWRTQFTHMVVHDLRNPVTTLLSTMRMIDEKLQQDSPPAELNEYVQNSQRVGSHMLDMVDSLMDINRLEAGQLVVDAEAMRLPPLVKRIVDNLLPIAHEKKLAISVEYADELPAVWADEELVRRILLNLFDNALKFTPQGGRIHGRLQAEPAADPTTHEAGVRITLTDNGPGIPEEHKARIFERFVRISSGGAQVRGTGIGLSFCKLAVEAQEGQIWVEDTAEGGSCFVFTLPGIPIF